jgi:hypothetical protein
MTVRRYDPALDATQQHERSPQQNPTRPLSASLCGPGPGGRQPVPEVLTPRPAKADSRGGPCRRCGAHLLALVLTYGQIPAKASALSDKRMSAIEGLTDVTQTPQFL